jgi:hypothetical protein
LFVCLCASFLFVCLFVCSFVCLFIINFFVYPFKFAFIHSFIRIFSLNIFMCVDRLQTCDGRSRYEEYYHEKVPRKMWLYHGISDEETPCGR